MGAVPGRVAPEVERIDKADAERDLDALLERRALEQSPERRRRRLARFNEVIDD